MRSYGRTSSVQQPSPLSKGIASPDGAPQEHGQQLPKSPLTPCEPPLRRPQAPSPDSGSEGIEPGGRPIGHMKGLATGPAGISEPI
jgi:hypothetical protein